MGDLNLTFSYFSKGSRLCKRLRFGMHVTIRPRNGTPIPTPLYLFNPPYLTLCRRKGGPKSFDSKYFKDSNFFGPTIFLDSKLFWTQNFFEPEIVFAPKFFFDPKIFWPKIFLTQNFFGPKMFLDPKFFWTHIFFGPKIFLDPKFLWTQKFCGPKILLAPKFQLNKEFDSSAAQLFFSISLLSSEL